jgi:hypothetical protein
MIGEQGETILKSEFSILGIGLLLAQGFQKSGEA